MQKTYIHEYPHPRVIVHYHPAAGEQLTLDHVEFALVQQVHAIELDLHERDDRQIVANHDSATPESPTLGQAIQRIVQHAHEDTTVHHDNRQFMLVLEPKHNDARLFDGILQILRGYTRYLSTAVEPGDSPRGITVVITGDYVQQFAAHFTSGQRNRLCIVEGYNYGDEIINLAADQAPFQWAESIQHDGERGRVNALHSGADPQLRGAYNVRVWDCQTEAALSRGLASGADAINADRDQVVPFQQMIAHQHPRGAFPALSIQGSQALVAWRGAASDDLVMAFGTLDAAGLRFSRQILLTAFLDQMPVAIAPAAALCSDRRLLIAYMGADQQRLWYVSGRLTSADRFLTFDGRQRCLASPSGAGQFGGNPSVALGRDGRVLVAYQRPSDQAICYFSGLLREDGELAGQAYCLAEAHARIGARPSIAIDAQDRVIVVYEGAEAETLWYVAGSLDSYGTIVGREFALTAGAALRGHAPSVALHPHNRVIVAYQGTDQATLWYVSGTLDSAGNISGREYALAAGAALHVRHPTIASGAAGDIVILYEATSDQTLRYLHGQLDPSGRLVGREHVLAIGMDHH